MSEFISYLWPFLVILVVLFIIVHLWMALVDKAASGVKKVLGIRPKEVPWHSLDDDKKALGPSEDEGLEDDNKM